MTDQPNATEQLAPDRAPTLASPRPPLSPKRQRISPALRHAIDVLTGAKGVTILTAATQAGLSPEHLSRCLKMPHVRSFANEKMRANVWRAALRGSERLCELIDASSEQVSIKATELALRIEGIAPPESAGVQVNVNQSVGYVVDWRSARQVIEHQPPSEPKPLPHIRDVTPDPGGTPQE